MVHIEIDGKKVEVNQGEMIIEAADRVGIEIPRFCYHKKLSIAANCRMCLVEVEKAPKALPACATPVSEGMKVHTRSACAKDAQKAVMEFLLINHPLDCPICDQGGQCELQDVALEYGKSGSRFEEQKRVVEDKNIGPLISTEMTRCIHCTRCVRFGEEIAGNRELGATGRGEFMKIGTYVETSVDSELSGNVIDLCPVGALTSKPFRFTARAWELKGAPGISAHECVGSNVFYHLYEGRVKRTLPRENEALNQVWLSDRDRFAYEGLNHSDRLTAPMIKKNGRWEQCDWSTALEATASRFKDIIGKGNASSLGAILSPNCTVEEFYLAQKWAREIGCPNIDHRLRQSDFSHEQYLGTMPGLNVDLPSLEEQNAILVVGSDMQKEQPLINLRLRQSALKGNAICMINAWEHECNFDVAGAMTGDAGDILTPLLEVLKATGATVPEEISPVLSKITVSDNAKAIAHTLLEAQNATVLLGMIAWTHPRAAQIYQLTRLIADAANASWGETSNGANSAGGWLAGAVSHRTTFGSKASEIGLNVLEMWEQPRKGYLLVNCEPELDCATPHLARSALDKADTVVALTAFDSPAMREYADVLLPITPITEMAGTYINATGKWQSFTAATMPLGESRPAWKILRVLGNLFELSGFEFDSAKDVLDAFHEQQSHHSYFSDRLGEATFSWELPASGDKNDFTRIAPTPLYAVDGITRRATALQETKDANVDAIRLHPLDAEKKGLSEGTLAVVIEGSAQSSPMRVQFDHRIPKGAIMAASGITSTSALGAAFSRVDITPVKEEI